MQRYLTLVRVFWQHLIRRKSLWVLIALVGVVMLINAAIQSQMKGMLNQGVRYDIATRRAVAALDAYADQIRQGAVLLVLVVGALVAPASNDTRTIPIGHSAAGTKLSVFPDQANAPVTAGSK